MRILKWLGGTFLALLVLIVGVGTYRSLTALPSPPPMIEGGTLTFAEGVEGTYEAGDLKVVLGGAHGIEVYRGGTLVLKGPSDKPFIWVADMSVNYVGLGDTFLPKTEHRAICDVVLTAPQVTWRSIFFSLESACFDRYGKGRFEIWPMGPKNARINLFGLAHMGFVVSREYGEPVFGGGEQFSTANLDGRYLPLVVAEQGIWRGDQPWTGIVNALMDGITGDWYSTYAPIPLLQTRSRAFYLPLASRDTAFDLRAPDRISVSNSVGLAMDVVVQGKPKEKLVFWESPMRPLPHWIGEGAVLGIQGGTDVVRAKVKAAKDAGVPLAGVWLQDWQGQRRIDNSERLWWNWVLDRDRYPDWEELVADLEADSIRVMTYINPYLVDVGDELPGRRNLYQEAKDKGYLVTDVDGAVRHIHSGTIEAGVVDLFKQDAAGWYANIIAENLIGTGASGFMADFGESFPMEQGVSAHNAYPVLWAETVRKAIDAAPNGNEIVAFHRSGFTDSPRHATAFWAGDQLVNWGKHDGFKSAITAMMTSGISGMAYNHSDIGGYTTVVVPPLLNIRRDRELFQRWAEFAAFTPIFRTHEGNQPRENHQFDTDAETLTHFAKMTRLFRCLHPYRKRLMAEHSKTGAPLMRHPWLHYPDDKRFHGMTYQQMMLGPDLMVVPVSDPGQGSVAAYLPDDGWELFWSGKVYQAGDHQIAAPIGQPAFFVRPDSAVKRELEACGF